MDDFVPQFHGIEDEYEIPTSSSFSRPNKHLQGEEDVMELMWQNGGLVAEKPSKIKRGEAAAKEIHSIVNEEQHQQQQQHLFMQEDELASWLLDDRDLYGSDLLYSAPTAASPPALRLPLPLPPPPPPPPPQLPVATNPPPIPPRPQNFGHFARFSGRRLEPARDSTVDDANVNTLLTRPPCTIEVNTENGDLDRKRKAREGDDKECQSQSTEDIEFEANEAKKPARSSASAKRTRASEVHNLSERRRRDRINEKMKALQELIPRCNKVDKASMLDEAIEYLKSLQMQVQMMSMGCGMVPMMYPGMHQYMPAMGMGMGMGMNGPLVPYPSMMPGSSVPNPAAPPQMGHTFPMPAFHLPPPRFPDPSRVHASNQTDSNLHPLIAHNPNQPRLPHFLDPYQQFIGHQQNQSVMQLSASTPSTSKETVNPEHRQNG